MITKPDYRNEADRERMSARLNALNIAHDRDAPADQVVERAKAYIAFIEGLAE